MTTTLARLLAAIALTFSLGLGLYAAPAAVAQDDTATEVTEEGEDAVDEGEEAVDEAVQEGEEAVDEVQQEGEEAVDAAQEEVDEAAAQVTNDDDDDDFDDWGLLGLLGLLGLGGLLKRPERNIVVDETPATRVEPTTRP